MVLFKPVLSAFAFSSLLFTSLPLLADGMVPETSLLVIDEATHSGTMNIKNTDNVPALLYTKIIDLPDDNNGIKLIPTQPIVRVEPGQTQQLRFILQTSEPLVVEHYKRVTFEGIPPKKEDKNMKIGINIRQDLPVLIRPATLAVVTDAWTELQWHKSGTAAKVVNPSKYVVRLAQEVVFKPSGTMGRITKTYILPGETLDVQVEKSITSDTKAEFFPASRYGVEVPSFTAELNAK